MALFKIKRGLAADLPTSYVEGYCYVTTDDGKFYIDTSNSAAGRIVLNAAKADKATVLATARSLQTNLASTTAALFDGSGNASIGVTGTLAVGNGGTGKTSWTKYGLVYASASATLASLGVGTSGQVLSSKGTTSAPQWINQSSLAAGTAGKFASAQTIALTGDITGSASSQAGWSIATTLADSGVTAGSYGPSANASPAHGGTFKVPYITFDAKGRATAASTKTITLPIYAVFTGATPSKAGTAGLVPAPAKNQGGYFLRGDGSWYNFLDLNSTALDTISEIKAAWESADGTLKATLEAAIGAKVPIGSAEYIKGLSISGRTITYTKGDGTTRTLTTQDNDTHYTANLYLGGSTATSNATTAVSNPYLILRENNTNRTVQLKSGGNISISGVNGVATFSVPTASGTVAGVTIVYPAASCTTFSSDSGTVTPLAVQKGAKMFAITRPASSTTNAITRFSNTTGDVKNSKIIIEDVTNTKDTTKKAQVLTIPAEGGKKMVYGYCTDQTDGTSFIGGVFDASATSYPYSAGLAIGGTSGNLLWKGSKVLSANDLGFTTSATNRNYAVKADANGDLYVNVPWTDTNTHAVSSVNGKTGAVSLTYSDVGAAKSSHNHTWSNISDRASCTINTSGTITGSKVYGAVWNDYAEYRWVLKDKATDKMPEPGRCVVENGNDSMSISNGRLQPGAKIISDTYGMCMGETEKAKTPIAVCGRVLAHPFERKIAFNVGDAVCSGPNGTVSRMTREEIMMYPERIVGTVVSKPTYKEWGPNKIPVNGRIWIQVK